MLNTERPDSRSKDLITKSLTDDPNANSMALGCADCSLLSICGGLSVKENIMDCLDLCCGNPSKCTRVCRNSADAYVDQVREIGDFHLRNVPRAPVIPVSLNQDIVPLIYHGGRRASSLPNPIFALQLPDLINFVTGTMRFQTHEEICTAFHINTDADLILTGVNLDRRIEPWWTLGSRRIPLIKSMVDMGIKLVTSPNFSLFLDHPRHDDMHAMKRIALLFAEFQSHGMACALHPNGRTETDFERWGRFIAARDEIQVISYEFITGTSRKNRIAFHLEQLAKISEKAGRDLDIILRGDASVIPVLQKSFRRVIYIETTSFIKSINRQRAIRVQNNALTWVSSPTEVGEPIDPLFAHNLNEQILLLRALYYGATDPKSKVA